MAIKRKRFTKEEKKLIWQKTDGHCHFCGQKLTFNAKRGEKGRWQIDHVFPLARGGKNQIGNFLPICRVCNRLRWYFPSRKIRKLFNYGAIAYRDVIKKTRLGRQLRELYKNHIEKNKERRKGNLPTWYYK